MNLIHVKGNTYFLDGEEAIPVYIKEDRSCILLDSGWCYERESIEKALKTEGLCIKGIIGSHSHTDHSGNHRYFQEKYGIPVALPYGEAGLAFDKMGIKAYLHNFSIKDIESIAVLAAMEVMPDILIPLNADQIEMDRIRFGVMRTRGHSPDHIAITTPDGVMYAGDALLSTEFMRQAKTPCFISVKAALESMRQLKELDMPGILAHKGFCESISKVAGENYDLLLEKMDLFRSFVTKPMTFDEVLAKVCDKLFMRTSNPFKAKLYRRDLETYLEYLVDERMLRLEVVNGMIYFEPGD